MAVCKECGALNPDNNKFCSECGQPIVKLDSQAIRDAMLQLEAEFEQDALVNLDRSRLTYICDVCGKVNPIDAKQCLRCGKKRPRTDYINALSKIKNSKELKRAVDSMERVDREIVAPAAPKAIVETPVAPPAPVLAKEEQEEVADERQELSLYRLNPANDAPEQNRQIVQPFVIVPYVSQNQPLLQYDPNEVYRYLPYSAEEKRAEAERQAQLIRNAEQAKAAQEEENHKHKKRELEAVLSQKKRRMKTEKKAKRPVSGKIRAWSLLTLILAVAGILAAFIDLIVKDFNVLQYLGADAGRTVPQLFEALTQPSFANGLEIAFFMQALLVVLFLAVLALIALQSLIRLCTGRIRRRGILNVLLPLIALTVAVGIVLAGLAANGWQFEPLIQKAFGWIVAVAVSLILIVCYARMGARKKKSRK